MDLQKYLNEYRDMFGEQFPMMACLGMEEDEIIREIRKCIDKKKVYEYDTKEFH